MSAPRSLGDVVGGLLACYPAVAAHATGDTATMYVRLLDDLPLLAVERAVMSLAATSPRFPTVAEIRTRVVETALALPHPDEAWVEASRWSFAEATREPCGECNAGYVDDEVCGRCNGTSEVVRSRPISPAVREALDAMGGKHALREADNVETFRAQFLRLYTARRSRLIERTNVDALTRREILPGHPVPELAP